MEKHELMVEYDIVFAGGGAAACVAAGRLAKADRGLSILLIEKGDTNLDDVSVVTPALCWSHVVPSAKNTLVYKSNKEEALAGREVVIQTGGILGGGSSINILMYTRGSAVDYDSWDTKGWDGKTLMKLANKAETYLLNDAGINQDAHGHEGPIQITHGTHAPSINYDDTFAGAEAAGVPHLPDVQDFSRGHGMTLWAKYIGPNGNRQDAAHGYIHPLIKSGNYPNLHILTNSSVSRVLFDGVRATGVEYHPTADATKPAASIAAKKLVVVSAGALSTAPILERSGVGSAKLLGSLGIDVVSDLPGVGQEYQDHNLITYPYRSTWTAKDSFDGLLSGRENFANALAGNSTKMGWNGIDVCGKIRPSEAEVAQIGGDFHARWNRDFKHEPSRPLFVVPLFNGYFGDHAALGEPADNPVNYLTAGTFTAYPYSRGSVHITSRDPQAPASFTSGFLSDSFDLDVQVWAYKKQREIVRRSDKYAGEYAPGHPAFREGSKAACVSGPAVQGGFKSMEDRKNLPPIEYDEDDDKAIAEFIRERLMSAWHSMGTCKMAPREKGGVVDKYLNVYGTEGLKCGDLSIMPENVGANTYNTALIVGEKAAEIIGKELGLVV